MSFLAAIPVIGDLFDKVGSAIDKNVTSDHERLQMKAELTQLYVPVLTQVLGAQKHYQEMQVRIANIEAQSEHWLVWARRPIIAVMAAGNFIAAPFLQHMDTETAFYFAALTNGLDMSTRGVQHIVKALKGKERV